MNMDKKFLRQVMKDVFSANPVGKYDAKDPESTLKEYLCEQFGVKDLTKLTARDLDSPAMYDFYTVMLEEINADIPQSLEQALVFAEYANVSLGDQRIFAVDNPELFDIQVTAKGNGDVEVQRMSEDYITITTEALTAKFEVPFMRWASGRIDFDGMKQKVVDSYVRKLKTKVYEAFFAATGYNNDSKFNVADGSGFVIENLNTLIDRVSAANGQASVLTLASPAFIRQVAGSGALSDGQLEEIAETGFLRMKDGNMYMAIEHTVDENYDFVFDNTTAIVLPVNGTNIVKIVEEGETIFNEQTNINGNMSKEYMFQKFLGVGIATATINGRYEYTPV